MTSQPYRMLARRELNGVVYAEAGDLVYRCNGHDYGCASEDTRYLGFEHKSMTKSPTGDYPFFTVPVRDMEPVLIGEHHE